MSRLQVLVTTMHKKDMALYREMNLQTDAVIANQADYTANCEEVINGRVVKMVSTTTRGLSRNRNIALDNAIYSAEYIMFSDDDLLFHDGYEDLILKEFEAHPEADAIKFNLNCVSERKIAMSSIKTFHKAKRREVTSWGVLGVFKAEKLLGSGLRFNENFGTGTENYCGEDTIFLQELFKKKIALYASPVCIADIDQSESSWFKGYDEKYFYVGGKIFAAIYPAMAYLLAIRSAYKFSKRQTKLKFGRILTCYWKGITHYLIHRS